MAFPNNPTSPPVLELNSHAINTSCVGFWPLTQVQGTTATDISTGGNDGTQSGGVTWASTALGNAASFDGTDDYIDCTAISQGAAGSFTLSVWCNPDTASKDQRFLSKWNVGAGGTNPDLFNIWYDIGGSNVGYAFAVKDASLAQTIIGDNTASGGVGVWSHVVGVYDSAGPTMTLYVDGVQVASGAATGPIAWNTNNSQSPVRIGAILAERADGLAQNVRIFNTALSSSDVALLYSRPWVGTDYDETFPYSPPVPSSMSLSTDTVAASLNSGCVAWWPLTEGVGTNLADISGNGLDATLTGTNEWENLTLGNTNFFDNTVTRASYATTANTQPDLTSAFTISIWNNFDESQDLNFNYYGGGVVLGNASGSSDIEIYFNTKNQGNSQQWPQLYFNRSNGGTSQNLSFTQPASGREYGVWRNYVITFDGTDARAYQDGVFYSLKTASLPPLSTSGYGFRINDLSVVPNTNTSCRMQNVRVWDRVLTADEITLLYERPWEGEATYGDLDPYDPPPTLALKAGEAINTGCVGWWPLLEEDDYASGAADISGNANNGTQSGGVLSAESPLGGVASFDGIDDYIEISDTDDLSFGNGATDSPMTISGWVYINNYTKDNPILSKYDDASPFNGEYSFVTSVTTGKLSFQCVDGSPTIRVRRDTDSPLPTGRWVHAAATYTGGGTDSDVTLYVDGVQVPSTGAGQDASYVAMSNETAPVQIGSYLLNHGVGVGTRYFDGNIQNVRIWDRALSAVEVQSLYETPWIGSNYPTVAAFYNFIFRGKRFRRL